LENALGDGGTKRISIFIWFRPDHSAFLERVNKERGMLLHCRASLLLLAETGKEVLCFFLGLNCLFLKVNRSERAHLQQKVIQFSNGCVK